MWMKLSVALPRLDTNFSTSYEHFLPKHVAIQSPENSVLPQRVVGTEFPLAVKGTARWLWLF